MAYCLRPQTYQAVFYSEGTVFPDWLQNEIILGSIRQEGSNLFLVVNYNKEAESFEMEIPFDNWIVQTYPGKVTFYATPKFNELYQLV